MALPTRLLSPHIRKAGIGVFAVPVFSAKNMLLPGAPLPKSNTYQIKKSSQKISITPIKSLQNLIKYFRPKSY